MIMGNEHKKYRKAALRLYRFLILVCTVALIAAVIYAYFRQEVPA